MGIKEVLIKIIEENKNDLVVQTYDLKKLVVEKLENNRNPMTGTILRRLRELRKEGYTIDCISQSKSLYSIKKNG